jgi:acyl carrier protein
VTEAQVLEKLTPIFRSVFDDDTLVVTPEMTAEDVERWDSLSHIDMIMLVEQSLKVRIPTREVTRMRNVGDLVRVVLAGMK